MILDEQILNCARANGYTNKNYGDIDLHLSNGEIEIKRPKYSFENGAVYFKDPGHWEIYNSERFYQFVVTDEQLKQWQRDYKLKQIGL
jgi:hypothetical protein